MKKQSVFRLLSLFVLMFTMSGQMFALDWLADFLNDYYNNPERGPLCYSKVNAHTGLGEGKVYLEWATGKNDYDEEYIASRVQSSFSLQSPDNASAHRARSASYKDHKYIFFAAGEDGWEFENLYSDVDLTTEYPHENQAQDGIYAGQIVVRTTATNINDQPVVNLYARFQLNVTLNSYGLSTLFYSKYNFKVPNGVEAATYKFVSDNKQLVESTRYRAGGVIPAGEAVVLKGTANTTYKFIPVKGNYTPDDANDLEGTDTETQLSGDGKFYALSAKSGVVGFYWMNSTGAAFKNGAHKAYLHLSSSAGSVKGFAFGDDDATGIQAIENKVEDGAIYNIAGQRVGKMQKGINIVNGKKIMVK